MTPNDLLQHYGSLTAIAKALGCALPTVHEWVTRGTVPMGRQYQAELATGGALKACKPALRTGK